MNGLRENCLAEKKKVSVERDRRKVNLIQRWTYLQKTRLNGSRSVENLSSTNSRQMNLSRCYRESVDDKIPRWIENLSNRQKLSQWIENPSKSYQDKFQKTLMDRRCVKIYRENTVQGSQQIAICQDLSRSCRA